jgi:hypothetical protein
MRRFMRTLAKTRRSGKALPLVLVCLFAGAARAQMNLLESATPDHAAKSVPATQPKAPAKPIPVKAPGEEAVLGRPLSLEGSRGLLQFERVGNDVVLRKLVLPGERLSQPSEVCTVDIATSPTIAAVPEGHPAGSLRWTVPISACPFSADVLDGAVLVSSAKPTCDFVAADCRVGVVGLWGPTPETLTPKRIKELEHQRLQAETTLRGNFKVLLHRAGKDKPSIRSATSAQAGFSSEREMTCRDYKGEAAHGFCSAQVTVARSLAIAAQLTTQGEDGDDRHKAPAKPVARHAAKKPVTKATVPVVTPAANPRLAAPQ